jgi:endogenous inhibitor of DNA gyrase (YacG/DUF329 family)
MAKVVPCPTCQRPVEWSEASPFRPFCSDRCKLIDLGAWITEKHAIPGEELVASFEDSDDDPDRPPRH